MFLTGKNLACIRGNRLLFENLSLVVREQQMLIISGKNGSGKTSLLRIIAGLLTPQKGQVLLTINNKCYDISEYSALYSSIMVYIGHREAIYNSLTVLENMKFWTQMRLNTQLLKSTIHYFQMYDVLNLSCDKLSAGWRKRLALTRLILFDADIWLMDEPFSNLDSYVKKLLINLINIKQQRGGIIILTSHTQNTEFTHTKFILL